MPLPPERRAGFDAALLWIYNLMMEEQERRQLAVNSDQILDGTLKIESDIDVAA